MILTILLLAAAYAIGRIQGSLKEDHVFDEGYDEGYAQCLLDMLEEVTTE